MPDQGEGRTVTHDDFAESNPETLTEEPLVGTIPEAGPMPDELDSLEETASEELKTPPEGEETPAKPAEQTKPEVKAMPDDTFKVTRADGTVVELTEDEIAGIAQKRIAKHTYRQHEFQRAAEAEKERADKAEAALAEATAKPATPPADDPEPVYETGAGSEDGEWSTLSEFNRAWYDWNRRQETAADTAKPADAGEAPAEGELTSEQAKVAEAFTTKVMEVIEEGKSTYEDFDDVVVKNPSAPFDGPLLDLVFKTADDASAVLYELGKDVELGKQVRDTLDAEGPAAAARLIGRTEQRIEDRGSDPDPDPAPDVPGEKPATKRTTSAPPVPPEVPSTGSVTVARDASELARNQREYEAWRNKGGGR